jgi:hypothetical protein
MHTSTNPTLQGHLLVLIGMRDQLCAIGASPRRLAENARAIHGVRARLAAQIGSPPRLDFADRRE